MSELKTWVIGWNEEGGWSVGSITNHICDSGTYVVELSAYKELERKLEVVREVLKSISNTKISGADIYCGAESMQFEARKTLNEIEK